YAFTQPIQMRLDEAESGITTDVGVKIVGPDVERLSTLASRVEGVLRGVPGAAEVKATAAARVNQLRLDLNREAMARYGVGAEIVGREVERALGASVATIVVDGPRRIGVAVRVPGATSLAPESFAAIPIPIPAGGRIPLSALARIGVTQEPEAFAHEGAQRLVVVGANIRGRDVGGFVTDATARLATQVPLPQGYRYEWGGQYRHQQTAMRRLAILVPLAIIGIYLLLFLAFRTVRHAGLIMSNVPFALVGGVAALGLAHLNLSISAAVGFIALFGIAVLNGVVMVSCINELRQDGMGLEEAVLDGAATRLRPVLMTALVAGFGFVPMALSTSPGAELQRPLATVVIGGLVTATALTLLVLPTLYATVERWSARYADVQEETAELPLPEPAPAPAM
ncbi:MAG TPA: efflux RND transporter permease subunit, partial [Gemmatimonadales bacterium]|nr:efflux RND transporter permease subunit [Gemmatimonadales bacterium]